MNKFRLSGIIAVLVLGLMVFQGCSYMAKVPYVKDLPFVSKSEDEEQPPQRNLGVKTIAVLPADIKTGNRDAARMIREKLWL